MLLSALYSVTQCTPQDRYTQRLATTLSLCSPSTLIRVGEDKFEVRLSGRQDTMAASPGGGGATQPKGSSRWKRCLDLRFPITIEPLVLLYTLSVGLNEVIRSNLIIEKICQVGLPSRPLGHH